MMYCRSLSVKRTRWVLFFLVCLTVGQLGNSPLRATEGNQGTGISPQLSALIQEAPDELLQVIVQTDTLDAIPQRLMELVDGEVVRQLPIINAHVVRLPARFIPLLAEREEIRWLTFDAPVSLVNQESPVGLSTSDSFDRKRYDGSDGNIPWTSVWQELGEHDGPEEGDVVIARFLSGSMQGIRIQGSQRGIQRSFGLAAADSELIADAAFRSATLSFSYRRKDFASQSDYVSLAITTDDGITWTELDQITGPDSDADVVSVVYDIPIEAASLATVRFVTAPGMSARARLYVDNISIQYAMQQAEQEPMNQKLFLPHVSAYENDNIPPMDPLTGQVRHNPTRAVTVRDEFDTISYAGENGSHLWNDAWQEIGEANGPGYGHVRVYSGLICPSGSCLMLYANTGIESQVGAVGVKRAADLTGATRAMLTFTSRRFTSIYGNGQATLSVSADGYSWHELKSYDLNSQDNQIVSEAFDISAFASDQTQIRFSISNNTDQYHQSFLFIDNVQIAHDGISDSKGQIVDGTLDSVGDEFTQVSYNEYSGLNRWTSAWVERGDDGAPASGDIQIMSGWLLLKNSNNSIRRSVNIGSATNAVLHLEYVRWGFEWSTDYVVVGISNDGGQNWTEIDRISGPASDSRIQRVRYDISDYISSDLLIALKTSDTLGSIDRLYINELKIDYGCAPCIDRSNLSNNYVESIGADILWNQQPYLQGQEIAVAVVDSGIAHHADFQNGDGTSRIIAQVDFTEESMGSDDYYGHGTHVAGTIGGNGQLSEGKYIGVAPSVNLVDVKVIDDYGGGTTSNVVAGLGWVLENRDTFNIRVVNLSLNSDVPQSYHESPLDAALEILWQNGLTVVVSVGNNGNSENQHALYPPANDPFVISVGAVDTQDTPTIGDDTLASFSAHGLAESGFNKPELIVPGVDIISTLASDDCNLALDHPNHAVMGPDGTDYFRMSGTSMASAVAAGAVALLLQSEPQLTPDQVKDRLMATAIDSNEHSYMRIDLAIQSDVIGSANEGIEVSKLLQAGGDGQLWDGSVWGSVNWTSVNWTSVNWTSVNWTSVHWDE